MASETVNITASQVCFVSELTPSTVYQNAGGKTPSFAADISEKTRAAALRFSCPAAYKFAAITGSALYVTIDDTNGYLGDGAYAFTTPPVWSQFNWTKYASIQKWWVAPYGSIDGTSGSDERWRYPTSGQLLDAEETMMILANGASVATDSPIQDNFCVYTNEAGTAANRPYLAATFDTGSTRQLTIAYESGARDGAYLDRTKAATFAWSYTANNVTSAAIPDQASAVFKWRVGSSGSYTTVPISGSAKSVTIPANTFPANTAVIEWTVTGTDETGHSSTIATQYFTTTPTVTVDAYNSPTGGEYNRHTALTFRWKYASSDIDPATLTQSSAVFYWREGSSGNWTSKSISGSSMQTTIAADTFPAAPVIQWYVKSTPTGGSALTSSTYSFDTEPSTPSCTALMPSATIEDGSKPIRFSFSAQTWSYGWNNTQIEITSGGIADTVTIAGGVSYYDAPAGSITAGSCSWRLRASNYDDTYSGWTASKEFVCVAGSPAPTVMASGLPFAEISWSGQGQLAYKVRIDDTEYGPFFGTEESFTSPLPLEAGEHTAAVSIQNSYSLWSAWGTTDFTTTNNPAWRMELSGAFGVDAALSLDTNAPASKVEQTGGFYVMRDGQLIARTTDTAYTDRLALGEHSYQFIFRQPNGNVSYSNLVTGTLKSCEARIAPADGSADWLEIELSENQYSEQSFAWSRTVSVRHVQGAVYPVAEVSKFADTVATYNTAFKDLGKARQFEQLRGRVVILKSRGGNCVVGVLSSMTKRMTEFYINFEWTLQRIHWEGTADD